MGSLKNRRFFIFLLAAVVVAVVVVGGYIFYNEVLSGGKPRDVDELLLQTDDYIQTGYYSNAEDLLMQLRSFEGGVSNWLRILNRAYTLSKNTDNYTILNTLSQAAVEEIPGSEELWYVRIFAELKLEKYDQAYSHASKHLSSENYPALITETTLSYAGKQVSEKQEQSGKEQVPSEYSGLLAGFSEKRIDTFIKAGEMTGDSSFILLAAVLAMHYGNSDEALSLIKQTPQTLDSLAHYYIACDAGDLDYAEQLLPAIREAENVDETEWSMLAADLAMKREQFERAKTIYSEVLDRSPTESWIPYLNLAWIADNRINGESLSYLLDAYSAFPDKKNVVLPLAWYFAEQENSEIALNKLADYKSEHPEDPDIELLYVTLSSTVNNPDKYKAALWQLYNRFPENIHIPQYLAWYLLGMEDYAELTNLLNQFERNTGNMEWVEFFRGAVHSLNGAYIRAEESFEESLSFVPRWETHYNVGLLNLKQNYLDDALDEFNQAEQLLVRKRREGGNQEPDKNEASLYIKIAFTHYLNNDYEKAKRRLDYGLEIEPHDLEGRLLLKKLEAAEKR